MYFIKKKSITFWLKNLECIYQTMRTSLTYLYILPFHLFYHFIETVRT